MEIRLPNDDDLVALARLAADGVHDPAAMPFAVPWTDAPSPALERSSLQWWWRLRAEWHPENWTYSGAVFVDGEVVGVQDLAARSFAKLRSVVTGSWLGLAHQRQGLGQEMRAAALHLAFEGLGAAEALSGAWDDNLPSLGVSRKLGYVENGTHLQLRRDAPGRHVGLRLSRDAWAERRRSDIEVLGLEPCLEMFGAAVPPAS